MFNDDKLLELDITRFINFLKTDEIFNILIFSNKLKIEYKDSSGKTYYNIIKKEVKDQDDLIKRINSFLVLHLNIKLKEDDNFFDYITYIKNTKKTGYTKPYEFFLKVKDGNFNIELLIYNQIYSDEMNFKEKGSISDFKSVYISFKKYYFLYGK